MERCPYQQPEVLEARCKPVRIAGRLQKPEVLALPSLICVNQMLREKHLRQRLHLHRVPPQVRRVVSLVDLGVLVYPPLVLRDYTLCVNELCALHDHALAGDLQPVT